MKSRLGFLALVLLWGTSGYVAHGYCLGDFTNKYPDSDHQLFCIPWSYMGGPVSLGISYLDPVSEGPIYLQTGYTKEQRWEIFHKKYPNLNREDFEGFE